MPTSISLLGSFRRHYSEVLLAARDFQNAGLEIRSPSLSAVVNPGAEFIRFASDAFDDTDQKIQLQTLQKILSSDIVYVVAPNGYVGRTTCYEIGRVHERCIPIFYSEPPKDLPILIRPGSVLSSQALTRAVVKSSGPLLESDADIPSEILDLERSLKKSGCPNRDPRN